MTVPAVRTVADEVWALLSDVSGLTHYDGEVTKEPPTDSHGVIGYTVFYPSGGIASSDRLSGRANRLAFTFQVTCVGGDRNRMLRCVDLVRAGLLGQRISIGRITEIGGDRGGTDYDTTPPRRYMIIDFGVRSPTA